jgi:hypothetical protein
VVSVIINKTPTKTQQTATLQRLQRAVIFMPTRWRNHVKHR